MSNQDNSRLDSRPHTGDRKTAIATTVNFLRLLCRLASHAASTRLSQVVTNCFLKSQFASRFQQPGPRHRRVCRVYSRRVFSAVVCFALRRELLAIASDTTSSWEANSPEITNVECDLWAAPCVRKLRVFNCPLESDAIVREQIRSCLRNAIRHSTSTPQIPRQTH